MLSNFASPTAQTTVQPAEGVPAIAGIHPYQQRGLAAAFRLPEDGTLTDDKEDKQEQQTEETENEGRLLPGTPEIFHLLMDDRFRELVDFFLTPGHQEIMYIIAGFREERQLSGLSLFRPQLIREELLDQVRHRMYLNAIEKSPLKTGRQFYTVI
ncbi:hypothetical protein QA596_12185 [Balneolales bacterium ANBcel1]|nr:hypothetical protein [Balneolales bacterium ANBcel1]